MYLLKQICYILRCFRCIYSKHIFSALPGAERCPVGLVMSKPLVCTYRQTKCSSPCPCSTSISQCQCREACGEWDELSHPLIRPAAPPQSCHYKPSHVPLRICGRWTASRTAGSGAARTPGNSPHRHAAPSSPPRRSSPRGSAAPRWTLGSPRTARCPPSPSSTGCGQPAWPGDTAGVTAPPPRE